MVAGKRGLTDEGLAYEVLRGSDSPPIMLSVAPTDGHHWTEQKAFDVLGQQFGLRDQGRVMLLRVVGVSVNPMTRRLELTCR